MNVNKWVRLVITFVMTLGLVFVATALWSGTGAALMVTVTVAGLLLGTLCLVSLLVWTMDEWF